eukprot:gene3357-6647_t
MSSSEVLQLLQSIASRLSAIEDKLEISGNSSSSNNGNSSFTLPKSVIGFDSYCATYLSAFVGAATKLGGDAETIAGMTKEAFEELRKFLLMAAACKEPAQAALAPLLAGLGAKMKAIAGAVSRNAWEKHTKTVSEGLGCLNWVMVKPAPCDFIESFIGGSDYWANGIRKEYRTTNPDQIAFCDTFRTLINEMKLYVKEFHTTGVQWNARGVDVSAYNPDEGSASSTITASPMTPAVTLPPAPAPAATSSSSSSSSEASKTVNLFAALNKGGDITSGLKTVTKDQQTWRAEYKGAGDAPASLPAPGPSKTQPAAKTKASVDTVKGPPKLEYLEGACKWVVENQTADSGVVTITIGAMKQTVYIFNCIDASINITGKCKSVIIDSCKKSKVYYDNIMASCEVVNCQRMHVECREKVASVAIDKTDGIVVQLPLSSLDTTVVASKSSEMNITWPDANGDLIERPIPEQYIHRISGTSITANVSDLYGH